MLEYSLGKYNLCESRAVVADRDFLSPCGACPHSGNESNVLNMPQKLMPDFTAVGFCSPFLARQPRGAEIRNPKSENRRKSEIRRPKDLNIEHRTSNIEHRTSNGGGGCLSGIGCWMLDVRCSMFDVSFFALLRISVFGFRISALPYLFPSNCARYCVGDWPRIFLNTRLKCVSDWNPTSKAISLTRRFGFSSRFLDFSMRTRER